MGLLPNHFGVLLLIVACSPTMTEQHLENACNDMTMMLHGTFIATALGLQLRHQR